MYLDDLGMGIEKVERETELVLQAAPARHSQGSWQSITEVPKLQLGTFLLLLTNHQEQNNQLWCSNAHIKSNA
jgi:hypothetical protein